MFKEKNIKFIMLIIIIIIVIVELLILVLDKRILIYEKKINPGEKYIVEEYGDLGDTEQASLACNYFNGRKVLTKVFWYSPNNIMGVDSCPFIYSE